MLKAVGAADVAKRRRLEALSFLVLTGVIMPGLAVAVVGGFGLIVWVFQIFAGPPGPPAG